MQVVVTREKWPLTRHTDSWVMVSGVTQYSLFTVKKEYCKSLVSQ
jgi:hypothetical protein